MLRATFALHVIPSVIKRAMDAFFPLLSPLELILACLIGLVAGFVKGAVGFAMPLIFISGLTLFLPPEIALAGLILPTVATNAFQAFRHGAQAAWDSVCKYRVYLAVGGMCLLVSAQFVRAVPDHVMLLVIGVPVTASALFLLSGMRFQVTRHKTLVEALIGVIAGAMGGVSAIWGPPTVAYLTAVDTPKYDQMRVQGVIYGLGAIVLTFAHIASGVLRSETVGFSAAMLMPALLGMWIGTKMMDRFDQQQFRRITLIVLLVAGVNLIRRGLMG